MKKEIKIGFFSDTHTLHREWKNGFKFFKYGEEIQQMWNELDILCFTGDCSARGKTGEVEDFMEWFNEQPAKEKVMIAGNHDFFFDVDYRNKMKRHSWEDYPENEVKDMLAKYPDIHYLDDSGVELFGLNIWGSPVQPAFGRWAFNRQRNTEIDANGSTYYYGPMEGGIETHWAKIPNNTDILLTHGPPFGHGDLLAHKFRRHGEYPRVGCADLKVAIERVQPKIVAFGHIHEGYSKVEENGITYINASSLNENYSPINEPKFHVFLKK